MRRALISSPWSGEIWGADRQQGAGHRQIHMCLANEFGQKVSAKSVLKVMRRMGLRCGIRKANPWRK